MRLFSTCIIRSVPSFAAASSPFTRSALFRVRFAEELIHLSFTMASLQSLERVLRGDFRVAYDYRSDTVHGCVLTYWETRRGARHMPARRDMDPTDIPRVLPHLQLIEPVPPDRFRYRLVGTAIVQTFGHDYTGRFLDELSLGSERINFFASKLGTVRDSGRPLFVRTQYISAKGVHFMANRLYVPLSENDRDVNMILGSLTFEFSRATTRDGVLGSAQLDASISEVEFVEIAG